MTSSDRLLSSRTTRDRLGGVSEMTVWRWVRQGILPSPTKINGRNFWPESVVQQLQQTGHDRAKVGAA